MGEKKGGPIHSLATFTALILRNHSHNFLKRRNTNVATNFDLSTHRTSEFTASHGGVLYKSWPPYQLSARYLMVFPTLKCPDNTQTLEQTRTIPWFFQFTTHSHCSSYHSTIYSLGCQQYDWTKYTGCTWNGWTNFKNVSHQNKEKLSQKRLRKWVVL